MDTIEHFKELFDHNDWANRRVVASLRAAPSERCTRILAHILTAQQEWFERLYGKDSTGMDFWPDLSLDECGRIAPEIAGRYERLLKSFDEEGLGLSVRYRTSKGVEHENTYREILTHVILHSSTHRGNIILRLREEGREPPAIDHIIYLREIS